MTEFERRLIAALQATAAEVQAPGQLVELIRRRHRRHRVRLQVAGIAATAVLVLAVPAGIPLLGGRLAHPPVPSGQVRAKPGTVLESCADQIAGQYAAGWKGRSIHAGPMWFVNARPLRAGRDSSSPLPFGNLPVNEPDNAYAWVRVTGAARRSFRFLVSADFTADGRYTLADGQQGVTFAACATGHDMGWYYPGVTQFWLGFVISKVPACVSLDLWTQTSKQPVRVTLAVGSISCTGRAHRG